MNDPVKIYGFFGSHPCEAVYAAAERDGVAYQPVEIPPALHRAIMKIRFGGDRVPAAVIGGRKVQGTTAIFHALDEVADEPRLFPADPELRARVEAADEWGEGDFQDIGRRLIWSHMARSPETVRGWAAMSPPGISRVMKKTIGPQVAKVARWANKGTDENVQADLKRLPELLDRVDELIAEGTIGTDEPNAADFQILSSVGLWMTLLDIRPSIEGRPCGKAAMRLFPKYDGSVPGGLLPESWFESLRAPVISSRT